MKSLDYSELLMQEVETWNQVAGHHIGVAPPDLRLLQTQHHSTLFHARDINALFEQIKPGIRVLELGCSTGILTVEATRSGVSATGIHVAARALALAQACYSTVRSDVAGRSEYQAADLNKRELPKAQFDPVSAKGVRLHLPCADRLVEKVDQRLKERGLFSVSDTHANVSKHTALLAGFLFFLSPTSTSCREKAAALLQFGLKSLARLHASMQAVGLSPFEGLGVDSHWLELVRACFTIEQSNPHPVIAGDLLSQVATQDRLKLPVLRCFARLEGILIHKRALPPVAVTLYARKSPETGR